MRRTSSQRGSALLIVLGMLSFMIISAVGFAAYMRYARQPSSFLRRTASTRQLTKAALAQAIDQIDLAIGNNPHPGVGQARTAGMPYNGWVHRVFTGTNTVPNDSMYDYTVAPLCLEALAYIPPPLVNEARYWSRLTPTAVWQPMSFDAGRFSWCAIDVSDYLDINRLMADRPRSSAPRGRISLAYLFENERHTSAGTGADKWDKFMKTFRGEPNEDTLCFEKIKSLEPLISVADLNLAMGSSTFGDFKSYFYEYIEGGSGGKNGFYGSRSEKDEETVRRMTFVTDSLFPMPAPGQQKTEDGDTVYDLNDGQYQPFKIDRLMQEGRTSLFSFVPDIGSTMQRASDWAEFLSGLGCAALFDYLDTDHIPVSLAIPTTERVPMICGIRPQFDGSSFAVMKRLEPAGDGPNDVKVVKGDEKTRTVQKTVKYNIESSKFLPAFMAGDVRTLVTFPFAHERADDVTFTMDGRFSLFFSSEEMNLRTGEMNDVLHLDSTTIGDSGLDPNTGLLNVKLREQSLGAFKSIRRPEDAVKEFGNSLREGQGLGQMLSREGNEVLTVTFEWQQTRPDENAGGVVAQGEWQPAFNASIWEHPEKYAIEARCNLRPLRANGMKDPDLEQANVLKLVQGGYDSGKDIWLNAGVWLRIKDDKGKVVDMVPACVFDDQSQNNLNVRQMGRVAQDVGGLQYPIFRFDTGVRFRLSLKGLDTLSEQQIKLEPEGALVADPRWNHAPEHWFAHSGTLTKETWLQNNHVGENGRDPDIFMATSDAGYMQSAYELAFLPRLCNRFSLKDARFGDMQSLAQTNMRRIPERFEDAVNSGLAWRTYDPFTDEGREDFALIPRTSAGAGFKVNPYSDSTNVLMAAFANTPIDWNRASTNIVEGEEYDPSQSAATFNKKYAFNEYATGTRLYWEDLETIAGRLIQKTHGEHKNWKTAWQELGWNASADNFCGIDMQDSEDRLWWTDRKFLYGFWRDCFEAKQQLFLVFVRTEPMMMGNEGSGKVRPQLGARAMAVVWRDPTESADRRGGIPAPHQTRVLFYRQFE